MKKLLAIETGSLEQAKIAIQYLESLNFPNPWEVTGSIQRVTYFINPWGKIDVVGTKDFVYYAERRKDMEYVIFKPDFSQTLESQINPLFFPNYQKPTISTWI